MVPSSLGSSGRGLPVVGTHLELQQVGMCKEASGGLMCHREKLEMILTGDPHWRSSLALLAPQCDRK